MPGPSDMKRLRTRAWPGAGSGTATSVTPKSPTAGSPWGRARSRTSSPLRGRMPDRPDKGVFCAEVLMPVTLGIDPYVKVKPGCRRAVNGGARSALDAAQPDRFARPRGDQLRELGHRHRALFAARDLAGLGHQQCPQRLPAVAGVGGRTAYDPQEGVDLGPVGGGEPLQEARPALGGPGTGFASRS